MVLMQKDISDQKEYLRHMNLITSYTEVLMGRQKKIPRFLFGSDKDKESNTMFLLKFLFVYVLKYKDMQDCLDNFDFEAYKLKTIVEHGFLEVPLLCDDAEAFILREPELVIRYAYAYGNQQKMIEFYNYIKSTNIKPYRKKQIDKTLAKMKPLVSSMSST